MIKNRNTQKNDNNDEASRTEDDFGRKNIKKI